MSATGDLRLDTNSGPIYAIRFNEDGSYFASGGVDKCLRIWNVDQLADNEDEAEENSNDDLDNGVYEERVTNSAITSLRWSNLEDSHVFISSADHTAIIYDLNKSTKVKTFHHKESVNQLSLSENDTIVTCCDDGKVRLWDVRSKFPISEINTPLNIDTPVLTCCIDRNSNRIYFAGIDPTVYCYDIRNAKSPVVLWSESNSHTNNVTSLSLSPDESYLLSKSIDGTIKYFDAKILSEKTTTRRRAKPYVFDGTSASDDDWLIRSIIIPDPTNDDDESDLFNVLSGSNDGYTYVWEFASRKLINKLDGHLSTVFDLDYSEINSQLVTCSADGSVILRDLSTGKEK